MFSLDVNAITDEKALENEVVEQVKPDTKQVDSLKSQAAKNVDILMDIDTANFEQRREFTSTIEQYGLDTMKKSSDKNALLSRSVSELSKSGAPGGQVANSLADLQKEVRELDPGEVDFTRKGLLGALLNPVHKYFDKYERSDAVIVGIVESLDKGKQVLKNDNTTLEIEEAALRDLTKKLSLEIEMALAMDDEITNRLERERAGNADADKIRFVQEEVQFPLRQRIEDMQQLTVVNQQGIIAMEVVRRNNRELMRGVDRAKNVTVSALRTAVMVASALYNQKVVLKKLQALDQTTNAMIAGTSKMLKEQGAEIHKQSLESGVSPDTLKIAFDDVLHALDEISNFKQRRSL